MIVCYQFCLSFSMCPTLQIEPLRHCPSHVANIIISETIAVWCVDVHRHYFPVCHHCLSHWYHSRAAFFIILVLRILSLIGRCAVLDTIVFLMWCMHHLVMVQHAAGFNVHCTHYVDDAYSKHGLLASCLSSLSGSRNVEWFSNL